MLCYTLKMALCVCGIFPTIFSIFVFQTAQWLVIVTVVASIVFILLTTIFGLLCCQLYLRRRKVLASRRFTDVDGNAGYPYVNHTTSTARGKRSTPTLNTASLQQVILYKYPLHTLYANLKVYLSPKNIF